VLYAILVGMLIPDNTEEAARATLQVLAKVVSNAAIGTDPKFRRLPVANEKIQQRIINIPGAAEFLDSICFIRENGGNGDFVLTDPTRLKAASNAIAIALATLPPAPVASVSKPASTTTPNATTTNSTIDDYDEKRKMEVEARQTEIRRKMEEDKRKKEALRAQIKAEQREVRDRPVVASHAVHLTRQDVSAGGGGDGKIRYTNSDKEFQSVVSSKSVVLANFTASWCGPCQAIAPAIEDLARNNPAVTFIKIDIDQNNETPSRFNVSAVPTFLLFKNGSVVGEVKGANLQGVQGLLSKA